MTTPDARPQRRQARVPGYDYAQAGAYFFTVCAAERLCLFGEVLHDKVVLSPLGALVSQFWSAIPEHHQRVETDAFVIMPNHVPGVIVFSEAGAMNRAPTSGLRATDGASTSGIRTTDRLRIDLSASGAMNRSLTLGQVIRAWKARVTVEARRSGMVHGRVWQRGFHEHIVRDEDELNRIRRYIQNNPADWSLDRENPHARRA